MNKDTIRRLEALQKGEPAYFGEPCEIHPHVDRWTYSGECTECNPKNEGKYADAMEAIYGPTTEITRLEAYEAGLKMFRSGPPCKHRHPRTWRYVSGPNVCGECARLSRLKAKAADIAQRRAMAKELGLGRVLDALRDK